MKLENISKNFGEKRIFENFSLEKTKGSHVAVLGDSGRGKTTLVKGIISMFEMQAQTVSLCAPTGRAAKRLTELSGKEAKTIHRLLEVVPGSKKELKLCETKLLAG